jgi:hypothetical protein
VVSAVLCCGVLCGVLWGPGVSSSSNSWGPAGRQVGAALAAFCCSGVCVGSYSASAGSRPSSRVSSSTRHTAHKRSQCACMCRARTRPCCASSSSGVTTAAAAAAVACVLCAGRAPAAGGDAACRDVPLVVVAWRCLCNNCAASPHTLASQGDWGRKGGACGAAAASGVVGEGQGLQSSGVCMCLVPILPLVWLQKPPPQNAAHPCPLSACSCCPCSPPLPCALGGSFCSPSSSPASSILTSSILLYPHTSSILTNYLITLSL